MKDLKNINGKYWVEDNIDPPNFKKILSYPLNQEKDNK